MTLSSTGGRLEILRNIGAIDMDVEAVEQLDLSLFAGADVLTANDRSATELVRLNIDLGFADTDVSKALARE